MPRPRATIGVPPTPESVAAAVSELQRMLGRGLSLGDPRAPAALSIARTIMGAVRRPPQLVAPADNMEGAWTEATLDETLDFGIAQNLRFVHGLKLPVAASRPGRNQLLNVRWSVMGVRYNTDAAAPATVGPPDARVLVAYVDGAVDASWIDLRVWTNFVIAGPDNESLTLTLYFWPASR
jgi:hypothetical protein